MPLATLHSLTFQGVKPIPVQIEVHLSAGLPSFAIVGLADTEIRESKERVRSALINSGFEFPSQRITVNLAPADLPKGTAVFDLAIALGIASASGQLKNASLDDWLFAGELSLSGALKGTRSPFALAVAARRESQRHPALKFMLPACDLPHSQGVPDLEMYGTPTLFDAAAHLVGHGEPLEAARHTPSPTAVDDPVDFAEVTGHDAAKHALLVAAAGQHHVRLVGSPGSGKSMLARRLGTILPPLPFDDALDVAAIRSLKGEGNALSLNRPFRNPHAGSSFMALIGGGNPPMPGEITLAHQGVLFTDEVLEFDRRSLESLREPLETGRINVSRAGHQATFPSRFLWICAHNPCPCGWLGHPEKNCRCTPEQIRRYQGKLSGPLADRLDISVEVHPIAPELLIQGKPDPQGEGSSRGLKQRVEKTRKVQLNRQGCLNGELTAGQVQQHCRSDSEGERLLLQFAHKHHLSSRALHRISRVARTLADLDECTDIQRRHLATAIQYRKSLHGVA